MDVSSTTGLASVASTLSSNKLANDVGVAVLNKALDVQAQAAENLIKAVPDMTQGLPEHIGRHINVTA